MRKISFLPTTILLLSALLLLLGCNKSKNSLLVTIDSKYDKEKTISIFSKNLSEKNYKITKVIDHTKRAKEENIYLRPTVALVIDNPKIFSALLTCNPSLAIDLPIRVSIYSLLNGETKLSYTQPEYWSLKHNIKDKNCISVVLDITRDFNEASSLLEKK